MSLVERIQIIQEDFNDMQPQVVQELLVPMDNEGEEEKKIFAREMAQTLIDVCNDLDQTVSNKEKLVFDDPRLVQVKATLHAHAGSKGLTSYVDRYDIAHHAESAPSIPFSSLPSIHGVDLEEDKAGIFEEEGAKYFEVRQLAVFIPSAIDGNIRDGRIGEADRLRKWGRDWADKFEEHYGSSITDQENLGKIFRNPDTQEKWRMKNPYNK